MSTDRKGVKKGRIRNARKMFSMNGVCFFFFLFFDNLRIYNYHHSMSCHSCKWFEVVCVIGLTTKF